MKRRHQRTKVRATSLSCIHQVRGWEIKLERVRKGKRRGKRREREKEGGWGVERREGGRKREGMGGGERERLRARAHTHTHTREMEGSGRILGLGRE